MGSRIEDVQLAKTGKSYRVRIGDKWYGAGKDSNIQTAIGRMVETIIETGDYGPWITRWKMSDDQTQPAGARPVTPHQGAAPEPLAQAGHSLSTGAQESARQLSAEELKVVNGIVMAAVQHGWIEELEQVQVWMKGIASTLREL